MPSKRKTDGDGGSSKPSSAAGAGSKPSSKAAQAEGSKNADESGSKKAKYTKVNPGITAKEFEEFAKPIPVAIGESGELANLIAEYTTFSTGSYGWKANGKFKITIQVDGEDKEVTVQAGLNLTVSGSKPDKKVLPDKKVSNGKRGRPRKIPVEDADAE